MKKFSDYPRYVSFSAKRDAALETILMRARAKTSDLLRHFMLQVQAEILHTYPMMNKDSLDPLTRTQIKGLDASLERHAFSIGIEMASAWTLMRSKVHALAHASEQMAIILVTGAAIGHGRSHDQKLSAAWRNTSLGPVQDRAGLMMSRLRRKIMDSVELSRIMGEEPREAVVRALATFPSPSKTATPKKELRRLREAVKTEQKPDLVLSDFVSDDEYESILSDFKDTFVPEWRDPRFGELPSPVSVGEGGDYVTYPWELEREMTEDFVDAVSKGQHEGAAAQGITDFVWVAVLDSHTDECCVKRDGLTTAEIAEKLDGEWADDECQAEVTPAHFNCRCRLVPASENLPDVPESNAPDFEEWLAA